MLPRGQRVSAGTDVSCFPGWLCVSSCPSGDCTSFPRCRLLFVSCTFKVVDCPSFVQLFIFINKCITTYHVRQPFDQNRVSGNSYRTPSFGQTFMYLAWPLNCQLHLVWLLVHPFSAGNRGSLIRKQGNERPDSPPSYVLFRAGAPYPETPTQQPRHTTKRSSRRA